MAREFWIIEDENKIYLPAVCYNEPKDDQLVKEWNQTVTPVIEKSAYSPCHRGRSKRVLPEPALLGETFGCVPGQCPQVFQEVFAKPPYYLQSHPTPLKWGIPPPSVALSHSAQFSVTVILFTVSCRCSGCKCSIGKRAEDFSRGKRVAVQNIKPQRLSGL